MANRAGAPRGGAYTMFGAAADPSVVPGWMQGGQETSGPTFVEPTPSRMLDLVFSATHNIETICDQIVQSELLAHDGALRVGLIAYRDHPPQDHVYIVKNFGFTTNVYEMKENLNSLFAAGGGDGPEAATAALKAACDLVRVFLLTQDWRPDAAKMAILITDAPPHGIGEYGDGFPSGSPDNEDPIVLARLMSARGIPLFVVACEPALSGYQHAVDFYQGLVTITGGLLVPLTTASLLSHVVIAAAGEVMDLDRLHREVGDAVLDRMRSLSLSMGDDPSSALMDQVTHELHEKLLLRNESTKQLIVESIYRESEESTHNVRIWSQAPDVPTARPHIRKVVGSRLSQKFLDARRANYSGSLPYRVDARSEPAPKPAPSPSRIVSDFTPFQAQPGMRFQSERPGDLHQLNTGGYRQSDTQDMDDDDDAFAASDAVEDTPTASEVRVTGDNGQLLAYRQDHISLAQARRLAMQSVARAPTLDPWSYQSWTRSLQRKLLAAEDRESLVPELLRAYEETADYIALRPSDWHLYLSLATRRVLKGEAGNTDALRELLELHERSTHDSLDMSLFVRAASLWLSLYAICHRVATPTWGNLPETSVTNLDGDACDLKTLLETWTGVNDAPALHANGAYADTEVLAPLLPTDTDERDELLSEDAVRTALRTLYARCAYHVHESTALWSLYCDWEQHLLDADRCDERRELVRQVYVARLRVPHAQIEDTFQRFSSWVSTYFPADAYEELLTSANKVYADALRMWRERERHEASVHAPRTALEQWTSYLHWESHRIKTLRTAKDKSYLATEEELGAALYRRALHRFGWYPLGKDTQEQEHALRPPTRTEEKAWMAKAGRKSQKMLEREKQAARVAARALCVAPETLWLDYAQLASPAHIDATAQLDVCRNASRVLPVSGRLWALYLHTLARTQRPKAQFDAVWEEVLASHTLPTSGGVEALVPFLQARIDGERAYATLEVAAAQHVAPEDVVLYADFDRFMHIYELLAHALSEVGQLAKTEPDRTCALEYYTVDWIERAARALSAAAGAEAAAGLYPLAESVWENAVQAQPDGVQAHLGAAQYFARHDNDARARQLFKAGTARHGEESKMPLLDAWVQFEHARGSISQIEHAENKRKAESDRLWRQWYKAQYRSEAAVRTASAQPSEVATTEAPVPAPEANIVSSGTDAMQVDTAPEPVAAAEASATLPESQKRKADDAPLTNTKKGRTDAPQPARDREFSSVMVAGLPADAEAAELRRFFRECGEMVEIVGPRAVDAPAPDGTATSAALVEFSDREMASAALTRDLKRIRDMEVHLAPSYQCTLYVTNFAPGTDDDQIRAQFGKYGAIFDVRWPSRKFAQSRRFCYVQFVRADSAQAALAEHGKHWSDEFALQVYLSNPAHKKARSDAHANERELYLTGLPRSVQVDDICAFFAPHAPVQDVRIPPRPDGKSRGIAFVTFATALEAQRAQQATNDAELLGRRIAVSIAEPGRKSSAPKTENADDRHARSIVVRGLPADAQEALIQQAVEKALGPHSVVRVFWTPARHEGEASASSLVELVNAETAGRAVLGAHVEYQGLPLSVEAHTPAPKEAAATHIVPRSAVRGRGGHGAHGGRRGALGFARVHTQRESASNNDASTMAPKGQDQFRAMLYK
ncbi:Splicing factor [Malassezia brasiliensis]|uniref:Splicing factor n=1 Tax=Malassezia brasiliensis TaxID=1821822 RepID=A0AAF0IPP3_9BASI|nr:Splicing factor [Malassezia brasiliensis]